MKNNRHRKLTYLKEALTAFVAFDLEKAGQLAQATALYSKASNALNWAIALEFEPKKRNIFLRVYDRFSASLRPIKVDPDLVPTLDDDDDVAMLSDVHPEAEAVGDEYAHDESRGKSPDLADFDDDVPMPDDVGISEERPPRRRSRGGGILDADSIIFESPNVKWNDVVGLENAMQTLKEAVILPLMFPDWFKGGRKPWRAILLYGPPGTGKTLMAKALAGESRATFLCVTAADLLSKYFGQSEKAIRELFRVAKERKPSVVFIDEVDSFCCARTDADSSEVSRRITNELLTQMQGIGESDNGVLVLGTTNIPWKLDAAIRRRFQKRIYIPLPDGPARLAILRLHLKDTPNRLTDEDMEESSRRTDGYSGSDIANLVQGALMMPIHRIQTSTHFRMNDMSGMWEVASPGDAGAVETRFHQLEKGKIATPLVTAADLFQSIDEFNPSVRPQELQKYEQFTREYGN